MSMLRRLSNMGCPQQYDCPLLQIYDFARNAVDWSEHLYDRELHFSVAASTASCTDIRSSMLVSTRVKDAVCDAVRSSVRRLPGG